MYIKTEHDSLPPSFTHSGHFFNFDVIFFIDTYCDKFEYEMSEREINFLCPRTGKQLVLEEMLREYLKHATSVTK